MKRFLSLFAALLGFALASNAEETKTTLYEKQWTCDDQWLVTVQIDNPTTTTYAAGDKILVTVTGKDDAAQWPRIHLAYHDGTSRNSFADDEPQEVGLWSVEEFPYTAEFTLTGSMVEKILAGQGLIVTGCDYTGQKVEWIHYAAPEPEPEPDPNAYIIDDDHGTFGHAECANAKSSYSCKWTSDKTDPTTLTLTAYSPDGTHPNNMKDEMGAGNSFTCYTGNASQSYKSSYELSVGDGYQIVSYSFSYEKSSENMTVTLEDGTAYVSGTTVTVGAQTAPRFTIDSSVDGGMKNIKITNFVVVVAEAAEEPAGLEIEGKSYLLKSFSNNLYITSGGKMTSTATDRTYVWEFEADGNGNYYIKNDNGYLADFTEEQIALMETDGMDGYDIYGYCGFNASLTNDKTKAMHLVITPVEGGYTIARKGTVTFNGTDGITLYFGKQQHYSDYNFAVQPWDAHTWILEEYTGTATGIKSIGSDAKGIVKTIENGQIVIVKGGVKYDITGRKL